MNQETLHLFECKGRHRIYRKSKENAAGCSRCGGDLHFIVSLPRNPGETEVQHHVRILAWKPKRVN
jgi:hypothetical protein